MENKEYKRDKRSPVPKNSTVSKVMSSIKHTNTKPEVLLRKMLFNMGLRGFRKNYKDLPGKPDIVYTKQKVVIFINGCYWHGCEACGWTPPKHNTEYWVNKITKTRQRDIVKKEMLANMGYTVLTVWEHEIKKNIEEVIKKVYDSLH